MNRILREPLLHFLLLGAVMFAAYSWLNKGSSEGRAEIAITQSQIASMAAGFTRTWQRPPTQEELVGLVKDRVREEVYVREAVALGLDRDDAVIRSHLRQKMEFVTNDIAAQAEPTDEELSAYLKMHPDAFSAPRQLTFTQIFLDPARHGENFAHDASQLFANLNGVPGDADVSALGDSLLLEHTFVATPSREIARQFGDEFAAQLDKLELGRWSGPVNSGYGEHLVFVSNRTGGGLPALADVRDAVRRGWANARRLDANEKFFEELLKHYTVTVEDLPPAAKNLANK
jgi:PPIC-type PPIASE domain